jgi:hypothetical protein
MPPVSGPAAGSRDECRELSTATHPTSPQPLGACRLALTAAPDGFSVADLATKVHAITGHDTYSTRQAAYDIRKLRGQRPVSPLPVLDTVRVLARARSSERGGPPKFDLGLIRSPALNQKIAAHAWQLASHGWDCLPRGDVQPAHRLRAGRRRRGPLDQRGQFLDSLARTGGVLSRPEGRACRASRPRHHITPGASATTRADSLVACHHDSPSSHARTSFGRSGTAPPGLNSAIRASNRRAADRATSASAWWFRQHATTTRSPRPTPISFSPRASRGPLPSPARASTEGSGSGRAPTLDTSVVASPTDVFRAIVSPFKVYAGYSTGTLTVLGKLVFVVAHVTAETS